MGRAMSSLQRLKTGNGPIVGGDGALGAAQAGRVAPGSSRPAVGPGAWLDLLLHPASKGCVLEPAKSGLALLLCVFGKGKAELRGNHEQEGIGATWMP